MKFFMAILLVLILSSQPVFAETCYSKREAEAEQGIRIHSEMMVISLNCAYMKTSEGKNLYSEHRKFTAEHGKLFSIYEKILIEYLTRTGVKNPEKEFHTIRTNFANKISKDAAEMRPDKFCKAYAPRIETITKMDETAFRKWAATPYKEYPVSKPLCK